MARDRERKGDHIALALACALIFASVGAGSSEGTKRVVLFAIAGIVAGCYLIRVLYVAWRDERHAA